MKIYSLGSNYQEKQKIQKSTSFTSVPIGTQIEASILKAINNMSATLDSAPDVSIYKEALSAEIENIDKFLLLKAAKLRVTDLPDGKKLLKLSYASTDDKSNGFIPLLSGTKQEITNFLKQKNDLASIIDKDLREISSSLYDD